MPTSKFFKWPVQTKKYFVIDFGQGLLKLLYGQSLRGHVDILAYAIHRDNNIQAMAKGISEFRRHHRILTKDVVVSISNPQATYMSYLSLPVLPEQEIFGAVQWQLKEEVSFDLGGAYFDWKVVKEYLDERNVKQRGMIFILAERKALEQYLDVVAQSKLHALRVGSGFFNYGHILKGLSAAEGCCAILDIDSQESTLGIFLQKKLHLVRRLPFSLEKFCQSLTGALVTPQGKVELTYSEAEGVVSTAGIPQDENAVMPNGLQASYLVSLMRPLLEALGRELKFSFDYFASTFDQEPPTSIYLTGFGANIKNLDRYLQKELNIKVDYLSLPQTQRQQPSTGPTLPQQEQNIILSAAGAMFEDPKGIDLMPLEVKLYKMESLKRTTLRATVMTVAAVLLLLWLGTEFQIRDYRNRIKLAQRHLESLGVVKTLEQNIQMRKKLLVMIQKKEISVSGILKTLSQVVPKETILNELLLVKEKHSLMLKGFILPRETSVETILTHFLQELEAHPFIKEANLVSSKTKGVAQEFEITCDLSHE